MNRHGFVLLVLGIIAMATWAYHVNYDTKTVLKRVDVLRDQIAAERERVQVLRVEWAWLNAPDRLRKLVRRHHPKLGLVPIEQRHLHEAAAAPYPPNATEAPDAIAPLPTVPVPVARPAAWAEQ